MQSPLTDCITLSMSLAWGHAPLPETHRVHGELMMRHRDLQAHGLPNAPNTPSATTQTWKTFRHNHLDQLVSIDFFTVPTVTLGVLFGFIVLEHRRREVLHFNVTEHPTAAWTSQQIGEAFADREAPQYLSGILYEIGMASTAARSHCGSRHCR